MRGHRVHAIVDGKGGAGGFGVEMGIEKVEELRRGIVVVRGVKEGLRGRTGCRAVLLVLLL